MDRVSSLPDELLCHILSFLTTKEAALTSILSNRWRNLLAFVPNLDIDNAVFLHPAEGKEDRDEIRQSFMDFVDRVLALQSSSSIKKFSLRVKNEFDSGRLNSWISNALARGVSELDLFIILRTQFYFLLSSKCFQSSNLVTLKLTRIDIDLLAGDIFLPMLKTLVVQLVMLNVDKFFLTSFPALEELELHVVRWIGSDRDVMVSNANLKNLTISYSKSQDPSHFSFDTPRLVYFSHSEHAGQDYPMVKMENLLEARISLSPSLHQIELARASNNDEDDVVLRLANVGKLVKGIRNVQYLNLSPGTLELLSLCCESMPVFNNLKSLTIKSYKSRGWQAMPVLLRNCPHLEALVLKGLLHHVTDKCGDACDCVSREDKGRSLTSCPVKVLEIDKFQGTMKEMHMIKHFLDYFPCLEEIKIYIEFLPKKIYIEEGVPTQRGVPEVSEDIAEMMKLYNKSSNCNVQLLVNGYLYKEWNAQ